MDSSSHKKGLFAPSAGQHLRDEQRRRRSQYDRGTSLAEREEYGFDDEDDEGILRSPCHQGFSPCKMTFFTLSTPQD
jgi:hypothetical protein